VFLKKSLYQYFKGLSKGLVESVVVISARCHFEGFEGLERVQNPQKAVGAF